MNSNTLKKKDMNKKSWETTTNKKKKDYKKTSPINLHFVTHGNTPDGSLMFHLFKLTFTLITLYSNIVHKIDKFTYDVIIIIGYHKFISNLLTVQND